MKRPPFNHQTTHPRFLGLLLALSVCFACTAKVPAEIASQESTFALKSSFAAAIKKTAPAVVNIYSTKKASNDSTLKEPLFRDFFKESAPKSRIYVQEDLGSGVIILSNGYILTNFHVVDGAQEVQVILADERQFSAKVIGTDPATDLAVIKINATNLPTVELGNSDDSEIGDVVLAIGNPFGVGQTVTMGIISATDRGGFGIVDYEDFIQIDAAINPGNSGGALCDTKGQIIGINTAMLANSGGSPGIGFAVPINLASYVVEQILREGRVVRGTLGLSLQPLTPGLARHFRVPGQRGALIDDVSPQSPASTAGLLPGDIITEYNGNKVTNPRNLRLNIGKTRPGTQANLTVLRKGEKLTLTAWLKETPTPAKATLPVETAQPASTDALNGVTVTDLESGNRRRLQIGDSVEGALVLVVEADSAAFAAGLRPGDVIEEINQQTTKNSYQAVAISRKAPTTDDILLRVWSRGSNHYLNISTELKRTQPQPVLSYH